MRIHPFRDQDVYSLVSITTKNTLEQIAALEDDYVLKSSPTELEQYFVARATIDPLELHAEEAVIEKRTRVKEERGRRGFAGSRYTEPIMVRGTQVDIAVPYSGDPSLWQVRASVFGVSGYPEIEVREDSVVFSLTIRDGQADGNAVKKEMDRAIGALSDAVGNLRRDIEGHNKSVVAEIRRAIAERRQQALSATHALASLGIPLRRRGTPLVYPAPLVRRRSPVKRPAVPAEQYRPEPVLEEAEYTYILQVLRGMSLAIERSPSTFNRLYEEEIRDFFLVLLNGHYDGDATGETFNGAGKTDILIRHEDRNVFVAECKFWRGAKAFSEAIDQLLGYLTWRDVKCALLVFNQQKDSTHVREEMHRVVQSRHEYRKTVVHSMDGDCRYILVKSSDPGREITLTTMLFDVPSSTD